MPITPQEAREIRKKTGASELKVATDRVDKALAEYWGDRDRVCVAVKLLGGLDTIQEVKRLYEACGWKVTYQSDQRDGDYLEFSA